eukprot:gene24895-10561_t
MRFMNNPGVKGVSWRVGGSSSRGQQREQSRGGPGPQVPSGTIVFHLLPSIPMLRYSSKLVLASWHRAAASSGSLADCTPSLNQLLPQNWQDDQGHSRCATFVPSAHRHCSSEASPPQATEKVQQLAEKVMGLTVLEASALSALLREKLGMPKPAYGAMPMMAASMGQAPAAEAPAAAAAPEEEKKEKTEFDVKLESYETAGKIKVIKEIRAITSLGLKEAKELVEKFPMVIKLSVPKAEAEAMKKAIEAGLGQAISASHEYTSRSLNSDPEPRFNPSPPVVPSREGGMIGRSKALQSIVLALAVALCLEPGACTLLDPCAPMPEVTTAKYGARVSVFNMKIDRLQMVITGPVQVVIEDGDGEGGGEDPSAMEKTAILGRRAARKKLAEPLGKRATPQAHGRGRSLGQGRVQGEVTGEDDCSSDVIYPMLAVTPPTMTVIAFRDTINSVPAYIASADLKMSEGAGFAISLSLLLKFDLGVLQYLQWYDTTCNSCGGSSSQLCLKQTDLSTCSASINVGWVGTDKHSTVFYTGSQIQRVNSFSLVSIYFYAQDKTLYHHESALLLGTSPGNCNRQRTSSNPSTLAPDSEPTDFGA